MSLPNYLAKIKSSGVYRFVWDKSVVPAQEAETLRLVVGYSEKGPFNTPVYIDNTTDFINIFGNTSKRLERRGIFFHRMAIQALANGPILALNLKPFNLAQKAAEAAEGTTTDQGTPTAGDTGTEQTETTPKKVRAKAPAKAAAADPEQVNCMAFDFFNWDRSFQTAEQMKKINVTELYDTNRFWKLDADQLPAKINKLYTGQSYFFITATDTKDASCTIFMRPVTPKAYDLTFYEWYSNNTSDEIPAYLEGMMDKKVKDYFWEIYVFRGKITNSLVKEGSAFGNYIDGKWNGYFISDKTTGNAGLLAQVNDDYKNIYGEKADALEAFAADPNSNFIAKYTGINIPYFKDAMGNYISLDILFNAGYDSHKMLMKLDESRLYETNDVGNCLNANQETGAQSGYFEGYDYKSIAKTDTGLPLQKKILAVLDDKGIRTALTNRVDAEYHYIVDTFQSYIETGCKAKLATIAKEKDNAFAILNFPPMPEFVKNGNFDTTLTTSTADGTSKVFDISKVASNPSVFSLVGNNEGASWCAYYTGLVFSDGALKQNVPSAALVSNNFMDKYGARQPYYIVAGPNYGVMSYSGLVGPDYNYGRSDLDVLEPMGVNAIIYVPRKGTYINSNQTAKQTPVSALSKIHIRELVIYLQDEIEAMLQNYQWELNTQALRDTIKAKADTILENVMNNGGVYAYNNICDETNNTSEVIDNEMVILDTELEPARGCGKMVQQLTIHRTGGITSSTITQ